MGLFSKAIRERLRLRLALIGPSGSGKSMSALAIATGLGGRIAAIDTEHNSLNIYADAFEFDVCSLESFSPLSYIEAINSAASEGYEVLIIDSLSHAWMGKGGILEQVDNASKRSGGGNSFAGWRDVTPLHNRLVDTMLSFPGHLIVTMRSKTEYVIETNSKGKAVPRKVGMAPIQRDNLEYEFTIVGEMNLDNDLIISKSRFSELSGEVISRPGVEIGQQIAEWLETGETATIAPSSSSTSSPAVVATPSTSVYEQLRDRVKLLPHFTKQAWQMYLLKNYNARSASELSEGQMGSILAEVETVAAFFKSLVHETAGSPQSSSPSSSGAANAASSLSSSGSGSNAITPGQIKAIQTIVRGLPGFDGEKWNEYKRDRLGVESVKSMSFDAASEFLEFLGTEGVQAMFEVHIESEPEGAEVEVEVEVEVEASPIAEESDLDWADVKEAIALSETLEQVEQWEGAIKPSVIRWLEVGQVGSTAEVSDFIKAAKTALLRSQAASELQVSSDEVSDLIVQYLFDLYHSKTEVDSLAAYKSATKPAALKSLKRAYGDAIGDWLKSKLDETVSSLDK